LASSLKGWLTQLFNEIYCTGADNPMVHCAQSGDFPAIVQEQTFHFGEKPAFQKVGFRATFPLYL